MPIFSVVMPLYNKSPFIREAIDSILNQSCLDFELIVVDDCSSDNSYDIVQTYSDPRIQMYRNSHNQGQSATVNIGIDRARGNYIALAHGDDVWTADFLKTCLAAFERFPQANLCHARAHEIDDNGNIALSRNPSSSDPFQLELHDDALRRLFKGNYLVTPTVVVRREAMQYFNSRFYFACDWDLWLRLAVARNDFVAIGLPLIYYRYSPGNVTSKAMQSGLNVIEDYLVLTALFDEHPVYREFRGRSLRRLSMRALRLSRTLPNRRTILLYHRLAAFINPWHYVNPVFYLYVFIGLLTGRAGLMAFRAITRQCTAMIKGKR